MAPSTFPRTTCRLRTDDGLSTRIYDPRLLPIRLICDYDHMSARDGRACVVGLGDSNVCAVLYMRRI